MSTIVLKQFLAEHDRTAILTMAQGKLLDDQVGQTAPLFGNLQRVKRRLLLPGTDAEGEYVARITAETMAANGIFQAATYPKAFSRPRLCCYGPGMDYRDHLDVPRIGKSHLRTDISVTICVTGGDSYDGGELVIDTDGFERRWKGDAGDCLVYASDSIHRVEPVTRGERVVIIFWIESQIRNEAKRKVLFDLARGVQTADPTRDGPQAVDEAEIMQHCHGSLMRMWAGKK